MDLLNQREKGLRKEAPSPRCYPTSCSMILIENSRREDYDLPDMPTTATSTSSQRKQANTSVEATW